MFEFMKNLFNKVNDKEARSLYDQLSNEFIDYINSDIKNSKIFWNTVTEEELDIIRYEYINELLIKNYLIHNKNINIMIISSKVIKIRNINYFYRILIFIEEDI